MSKPRFLSLLLIAALLSLSFSPGFGRRIQVMSHSLELLHGENLETRREKVEVEMDYSGPKANTNPMDGAIIYNSPAPIFPPPSH